MILIPVDPGAAFDALSILAVKLKRGFATSEDVTRLECALISQIGIKLQGTVGMSSEFAELLAANSDHFDLEDKAIVEPIPHSEIRESNMRRYRAKVALQKRFFPNETMVERKSMK